MVGVPIVVHNGSFPTVGFLISVVPEVVPNSRSPCNTLFYSWFPTVGFLMACIPKVGFPNVRFPIVGSLH
jgi:hypothetical protein